MAKDTRFKPGNRMGKGGARPNAGRKPSDVLSLQRQLMHHEGDIRLAYRKLMEKVREGNMDAIRERLAWVFPKAKQVLQLDQDSTVRVIVEHTGDDPLAVAPPKPPPGRDARRKRGD